MRRTLAVAAAAAASLVALSGTAQAAGTTEYVTAEKLGQPQAACNATVSGWCTFTRGSGTVGLVEPAVGTPAGQHLGLSTPPTASSPDSKAYALEYDNRGAALTSISTLAYEYSVQEPTGADLPSPQGDWAPAVNVEVDTNGPDVDGGYAVLVYEPLYMGTYVRPAAHAWTRQTPSLTDGWWTPNAELQARITAAQATPGFGRATWSEIRTVLGGATVLGIGVNQGGGNPGLASQVDLLTVNDTTYDFGAPVVQTPEPPARPSAADDCKNGGWKTYTDPAFPNQGQCIQFVNTGKSGQGSATAPTPVPAKPTAVGTPSTGRARAA